MTTISSMGFNEDYYWTGGKFQDWSGKSAGKFFDERPSRHSWGDSSGLSGDLIRKAKNDPKEEKEHLEPGPNDWKYGCGFLVVVLVVVAVVIYFTCWDTIYNHWFGKANEIEAVIDSIDRDDSIEAYQYSNFVEDSIAQKETVRSTPASEKIKAKKASSYKSRSSRYSSYDDEYDEDGMYKDEDEDIKDKRQYDDFDDDEADDWE